MAVGADNADPVEQSLPRIVQMFETVTGKQEVERLIPDIPQMLRVAQVGLHIFYRLNPHAPVSRPEDRAVFVSLPIGPASNLRLAKAVLEQAADATAPATGLVPPSPPAAATAPAAPPSERPKALESLSPSSRPAEATAS